MWSSIIAPQGHGFMPAKQQQQREFGMFVNTLPISTGKAFTNPNFVNNFNSYQDTIKPVDSSTKNHQNSCHTHIIDSIKKKCPEIISCVGEEIPSPPETISVTPERSPELPVPAMCLVNNKTRPNKRERIPKKRRQMGKHSRQNQKRQEIREVLQEDTQDSFDNSIDNCFVTSPHTLNLADFMVSRPSPGSCSPSQNMAQTIEIPISKLEIKAVSPCRSRQYSDSDDSFIVFDHDGNEEELKEEDDDDDDEHFINKESLCTRLRKPSLCESEDSFILFEGDENDTQLDKDVYDKSDYCYDSSEDESDEDDSDEEMNVHHDLQNGNHCDETDSCFSMIEPKKVRFASDHRLCEVHPMIKWSYAYQAARKGPWEMYARDRCRFKERIYRVERDIKHVFDPQHRDRIYKERFENL